MIDVLGSLIVKRLSSAKYRIARNNRAIVIWFGKLIATSGGTFRDLDVPFDAGSEFRNRKPYDNTGRIALAGWAIKS